MAFGTAAVVRDMFATQGIPMDDNTNQLAETEHTELQDDTPTTDDA